MKKRLARLGRAGGRSRSNIIVGGLIAQARKGRMTQEALGLALSRDQTAVAKIESGVRQLDPTELLIILDILHKDPKEFFDELRAELTAAAHRAARHRSEKMR